MQTMTMICNLIGKHRAAVISGALGCVGLAGCQPTAPEEGGPPDVSAFVTAALAASLDERGLVVAAQRGQRTGELDVEQAKQLAWVWITKYAPTERVYLERGYGGTIDPTQLAPCGRAFYGSSAFDTLPSTVPAPYRRMWGSWWLFTLCGSGVPQVLLAVSATADDPTIPPQRGGAFWIGSEFRWEGIPQGRTASRLVSPEDAIVAVAEWSGTRVAAAPELVVGVGGPFWAQWRVSVERAVAVKLTHSGEAIEAQELYLGPIFDPAGRGATALVRADRQTVGAAGSSQPEGIPFTYTSGWDFSKRPSRTIRATGFATVRSGYAVGIEAAIRK